MVEGTRRVHADRVINRLRTRPGQPVSEALLNDDVRTIEEMGAFANTTKAVERIGPGKVRVVFRVRELPYVGEVAFTGVGYFARQSIEKVVSVRQGGYLNPLLVEADRRAIQSELRRKQYLNARVVAHTEVDEDTGIGSITYRITLGEKVKVARTLFHGLPPGAFKYFIDKELLNRPGATFDPDLLELHDVDALTGHLRDLGYLDARVIRHRVEFFDELPAYDERARTGPKLVPEGEFDNRVVITYWVEPGQRYRLGQVSFVGNTVVTEEELRTAFALPAGAWFERRELERSKRNALALVRDIGYARAVLIEDPVADTESAVVDLTLQMREGDRYAVGRMDIDGNVKVKDAVIRRSLRLLPGDLWSDAKRDNSIRQIMRQGVFVNDPSRPTRIRPLFETEKPHPQDDTLKEVDVLTEVTEDRTGAFNFNIGFASSVGVIGQVSFSERNFDLLGLVTGDGWRGAAHRLDAQASWSEDRTSLLLSWTNPSLMDGPYLFGTSIRRTDSSSLDWDERRITPSAFLGRNFLDNDLRLRLRYEYTDLKVDDLDGDASDDALAGEGQHFINSLSFSQEYSLLDHPVFPTKGWRVELSETLNGVFASSSDDYWRFDAEFDGFLPLYSADLGGVTFLHLAQRWRQLEPLGDTDEVPFYDRLYGGGAAPRHRGFERFDLGPVATNANGFESRLGGNREWLTTLELSVPIQGTNQGLRGIVFGDIGQVWEEGDDAEAGDLRYAAGLGIRFPAAFPIAFDFAWLLDAEDGEDRTQFHFTISGFNF